MAACHSSTPQGTRFLPAGKSGRHLALPGPLKELRRGGTVANRRQQWLWLPCPRLLPVMPNASLFSDFSGPLVRWPASSLPELLPEVSLPCNLVRTETRGIAHSAAPPHHPAALAAPASQNSEEFPWREAAESAGAGESDNSQGLSSLGSQFPNCYTPPGMSTQ